MTDNEMSQQERDAAVIEDWRSELDEHDTDAQNGGRMWHFSHYTRADPEDFIRAALRTIDRLRADNEALRTVIRSAVVGLEVAGDFNLVAAALNERDHLRAALALAHAGRDAGDETEGGKS